MACGTCNGVAFVTARDGAEAGRAFARQAVKSYRRAVLRVRGLIARRALIEAYLCAKRKATK